MVVQSALASSLRLEYGEESGDSSSQTDQCQNYWCMSSVRADGCWDSRTVQTGGLGQADRGRASSLW